MRGNYTQEKLEDFVDHLSQKNNAASTIRTKFAHIKVFCEKKGVLVDHDAITRKINGLAGDNRNEHRYYDKEDRKELFGSIKDNARATLCCRLLFDTAARIGEIYALQWSNITFLQKGADVTIIQSKVRNRKKEVKLTGGTVKLLKEYFGDKNSNATDQERKNFSNGTGKVFEKWPTVKAFNMWLKR